MEGDFFSQLVVLGDMGKLASGSGRVEWGPALLLFVFKQGGKIMIGNK